MKGKQFTFRGQVFKINFVEEHDSEAKNALGWSHLASVSRPNGHTAYFANLFIVDGEIVSKMVVL